jgi:hypothetical protein
VFFNTKNHPFLNGTSQNVDVTNVVVVMLLGVCWLKVKYFYQGSCFLQKSSFLQWQESKCQWNKCCGISVVERLSAESQILLYSVMLFYKKIILSSVAEVKMSMEQMPWCWYC